MNKLTKGALTMVLVGSVTFPVTNALLSSQSFKKVVQLTSNTLHKKTSVDTNHSTTLLQPPRSDHNSEIQNKSYEKNQSAAAQITATEVKNVQTTPFDHIVAVNADVKKVSTAIAIQINTVPVTAKSKASRNQISTADLKASPKTTATTSTSTKSAIATATTESTTAKTTATTTPKTSATTSMNNHGQQVSQAARQKAANRQKINKVNNEKKQGKL